VPRAGRDANEEELMSCALHAGAADG
jgi:hypothetical protein